MKCFLMLKNGDTSQTDYNHLQREKSRASEKNVVEINLDKRCQVILFLSI